LQCIKGYFLGIYINYLIFYFISLILALVGNPWKKLYMLVQTQLSLGDAQSEKEKENIPAVSVLSRHRLSIDEAGFEAFQCMCLNIGKQRIWMSCKKPCNFLPIYKSFHRGQQLTNAQSIGCALSNPKISWLMVRAA
jgi:hypothetical protein